MAGAVVLPLGQQSNGNFDFDRRKPPLATEFPSALKGSYS